MAQASGAQLTVEQQAALRPEVPPDVRVELRDNYGTIYAGNRFKTVVGNLNGDLITLATSGEIPLAEPRARPVEARPRDFAGLIGRAAAIRQAAGAFNEGEPVEFTGPPGQGKTVLLRHLAWRMPLPNDGVLHLRVAGRPLEDVQHSLFAGFFTSRFPIKHYREQLLEHLRDLQALVFIDDVHYEREDAGALLDAMPRAVFVLAGEERRLWGEGTSVALPGLSTDEGVELFERALGRPLSDAEKPTVRELVEAREGRPLAIVQAAAAAREAGGDLSAVLVGNPSIAKADAIVSRLVNGAPPDEQRALGALAALPGTAMLASNIGAVARVDRPDAALGSLAGKGLAEETFDGRYRLAAGTPLSALAGLLPGPEGLLDYYVSWSRDHAAAVDLINQEAEALRALQLYAAGTGQHASALALARALDAPLTLDGQWATWDGVMDRALDAAQATGATAEEAWVLHQQGSRALQRLEPETSRAKLEEALRLREGLDDSLGAHLTEYHLDLWRYLFLPPGGATPEQGGGNGGGPGAGRILLYGLGGLGALALLFLAAFFLPRIIFGGAGGDELPRPTAIAVNTRPATRVPERSQLALDILSPQRGDILSPGAEVWLSAGLAEGAIEDFPGRVFWRLDGRRDVGEGADLIARVPDDAESGEHTLVAQLFDDDGLRGEAAVPVLIDREPEIEIIRPRPRGTLPAGEALVFTGEARDDEDGDISFDLYWESNIDGQFGQGGEGVAELSPGAHEIVVWVVDSAGLYVEERFALTVQGDAPVRARPQVRILSPQPGAQFAAGEVIEFAAEAGDGQGGDLSGRVVWEFGPGVAPDQGAAVGRELPPGRYVAQATITTDDGQEATATVRFVVAALARSAPTVNIERVEIVESTGNGAIVSLAAAADDADEGDLSGSIIWFSSQAGRLGQGAQLETELPPGEHIITAFVQDSDGLTAEARAALEVPEPLVANSEPQVEILLPQAGQVVAPGEAIVLEAFAEDFEDGVISDRILWWSSVDGFIGEGAVTTVSGLSTGPHVIIAEVTDASGAVTRAEVAIEVVSLLADLIVELDPIGPVEVIDDLTIRIPVVIQIANIGEQDAEAFLVMAEFNSEFGAFLASLASFSGSNGPFVIVEGLAAGDSFALQGLLRIESPEPLPGQFIQLWVTADSCADLDAPPLGCRVPESDEDNNTSQIVPLDVP